MRLFILNLFTLLCVIDSISSKGLKEEFTWTRINYEWPNVGRTKRATSPYHSSNLRRYVKNDYNRQRNDGSNILFIDNDNINNYQSQQPVSSPSSYIYENNIPMGANLWRNKLFITVPRRRLGVPSTLNYINLDNAKRNNPPLIPYPNWETNLLQPNRKGQQRGLVSVYRVAIDPCDRLWMVDTGIIETPGNITQVQPTSVVIIDLHTNRIQHRYDLKATDLRSNSNLASLAVDVTDRTCDDAYAYIPDLSGYGLIVYSLRKNTSWRLEHNYFYLESHAGEFTIAGHRFQWNDGIFSVALGDINPISGYRIAYFHAMAGTHLYSVSTEILRNQNLSTRSFHHDDFKIVGDRGALSQTSASDLHKPSGILFLGLVNRNALGCWNIHTKLDAISIVQKNDEKMIYPCDVKVANRDKIVVLTNTMPRFLYGALNYDQINFRIWMENVEEAVRGTKCEKRQS